MNIRSVKTLLSLFAMLMCAALVHAQSEFIFRYMSKEVGTQVTACSSSMSLKVRAGGLTYRLTEQGDGPEKVVVSGDVKLQNVKVSNTAVRITDGKGGMLLVSSNSTQVSSSGSTVKYTGPASTDNLTVMAQLISAISNPSSLKNNIPAVKEPSTKHEEMPAGSSGVTSNSSSASSSAKVNVPTVSVNKKTGTLEFAEGKYVGEIVFGVPQGKGVMTYNDGDRYEGMWNDGVPDGKGKYSVAKGDVYDGEWKGGLRHGYGVMTFHRGGKYEGTWQNDDYHGKGKMTYPDGAVYEGDYVEGYQEGQGTYTTSEGKYVGSYRRGKRNGQGTYTGNDGTVLSGNWTNGILDRSQEGVFSYQAMPVNTSSGKKKKK